VNDVIQPRFDRLASMRSSVAELRPGVVGGLGRISSGLEFLQASLGKLHQPVSLGDDRFAALLNTQSSISRPYHSVALDFVLPYSGAFFGYSKLAVVINYY